MPVPVSCLAAPGRGGAVLLIGVAPVGAAVAEASAAGAGAASGAPVVAVFAGAAAGLFSGAIFGRTGAVAATVRVGAASVAATEMTGVGCCWTGAGVGPAGRSVVAAATASCAVAAAAALAGTAGDAA